MALKDGQGPKPIFQGTLRLVHRRGFYNPGQCPIVRFGMYDVADMETYCSDSPSKKGPPPPNGRNVVS